MGALVWWLVAAPAALLLYAYLVYPGMLWLLAAFRPDRGQPGEPAEWPSVTVILPCYNEARIIARTIEAVLGLDYPAERLHLLVASDASTDRTDDIVRGYAASGVELLRLEQRGGKSAAENAAAARVRGMIVVNTDATTRILPGSLKTLVRAFGDPTVGVAAGRPVAVGDLEAGLNRGEAGYTGYEMRVRALETRVGSIVGASGCFFASRRELYAGDFPPELSRDFGSCLIARERGYRAVSVSGAPCLVPLSASLRVEVRRKARTMARGLATLWAYRRLLNPVREGAFAWMLFSHKLARWLFQLSWPAAIVGVVLASRDRGEAGAVVLGLLGVGGLGTLVAYLWPEGRRAPRGLTVLGFLAWANIAGILAWLRFLRGIRQPIWEPTRRPH